MGCSNGFGNLADGRPFWTGDFGGGGSDDLLFYYPGDGNWWLGSHNGSVFEWSFAGNTMNFGQVWDGRPFWTGDFSGSGKKEVLFYYPGDGNWWLGSHDGNQLAWSFAGNTMGGNVNFGQLADGRPIWAGDFDGDGRTEILFYYPGDGNWWLGSHDGGVFQWSFAGNTLGFGQVWDGRPFWTGDFRTNNKDEVLFYYPGDGNWWLGSHDGNVLQWSFAGNTMGFGQVWDGRPFWVGDFNGDGRADVLFYYPGDGNWWLGSHDGNQLAWSFAGNTMNFGQVWDGRPFFAGNFTGGGADDLLFYYPGDGNWWLGSHDGNQLAWSFAGNTMNFGQVWDGRPFFVGDFRGDGWADVLFYYPGDGNWWLGSHDGNVLQWPFAGNTGRNFSACISLNLILVGIESWTAADFQEIEDALNITRGIFAQVDLGIASVEWWQLTNAEAGALAVIDSNAEARQLTSDWTVDNAALDVFVVLSMNGADGWSAVNGGCDKDGKGMTGSVVSLNGAADNSGNTLAHEIGHYLGLNHIPDAGNFIGGDGGSNSWTGIYWWQGDIMKQHCFVF